MKAAGPQQNSSAIPMRIERQRGDVVDGRLQQVGVVFA